MPLRSLKRSVLSSGNVQSVARNGLTVPSGSRKTSGSIMLMAGFRLATPCSMLGSSDVIGKAWITVTLPAGTLAAGLAAAATVGAAAGAAVGCGPAGAAMVGTTAG